MERFVIGLRSVRGNAYSLHRPTAGECANTCNECEVRSKSRSAHAVRCNNTEMVSRILREAGQICGNVYGACSAAYDLRRRRVPVRGCSAPLEKCPGRN